jgi:arylsulfatase A-like enzyme
LIDLPPTFLTAGGIDVPDYFAGRSLQGLVDGSAADWPEEIFAQISESHMGRCVRTLKWKYSVRAPESVCPDEWSAGNYPGSDLYVEDFLYDLEADPHERNNLVWDPALANVREKLATRLKRRMLEAGEREPEIRPAD